MYRQAAALLIVLVSVSAFAVDSRIERWNLRIENLKKIEKEINSVKSDRAAVAEIIRTEIKSSEEFLSILNRYGSDDGSLKSETRKYSLLDIEKKVNELSYPVISLSYLSDVYKNIADTQVKEKISASIKEYAFKKFGTAIKITPGDMHSITDQYIIEKGMAEFDSASKSAAAELLSKVQYELSRSDYNSNESDFSRMVRKFMEDMFSTKKFSDYSLLDEKYLDSVPQWKFYTGQFADYSERNRAVLNFVSSGGGSLEKTDNITDIKTAEEAVFDRAKSRIYHLLKSTTPGTGAMGNNPYYEIPDLQKLSLTIDEIDRYRKNLMKNINGGEDSNLIDKLKSNNRGIASRGINRIEAQFRNEEMRIERLKKIKGNMIIYNEEIFKASLSHFYKLREEIYIYADLSADFTGALFSAGRISPQKFINTHRYRTGRFLQYLSFSEKLTAAAASLSASDSAKLQALYKSVIPAVLAEGKKLLNPVNIPAETRETLSRDHLKEYASINADFRTNGTMLIRGIRKNFDDSMAGFTSAALQKNESRINSESRIGQDETDRLFAFAKKCSDAISSMNYTAEALSRYRDEYNRISEELKKGNTVPGFSGNDMTGSLYSTLSDFNTDLIDGECAARELLAREGMSSLSGSAALIQHYRSRGIPVKLTPAEEEIISIKQIFVRTPEVTVSSWKMNGKNYRQIDVNVTAELKKLSNRNAWNSSGKYSQPETHVIGDSGITVFFNPPQGWKKNTVKSDDKISKLLFESPDKKGVIEITTVREGRNDLQTLAGTWPEKSGYSMTEKNWGKKDGTDYIRTTAKNQYDGIMESYLIPERDLIIILSGKTTGERYRLLNRTLSEIFKHLEIKG